MDWTPDERIKNQRTRTAPAIAGEIVAMDGNPGKCCIEAENLRLDAVSNINGETRPGAIDPIKAHFRRRGCKSPTANVGIGDLTIPTAADKAVDEDTTGGSAELSAQAAANCTLTDSSRPEHPSGIGGFGCGPASSGLRTHSIESSRLRRPARAATSANTRPAPKESTCQA